MSHIDVYKCDRKLCHEEKPAEYPASSMDPSPPPRAPNGWWTLEHGFQPELTFCSIRCLAVWAREERTRGGAHRLT